MISTHRDHLEANFSFRTRLLDCFWVGFPAVCTRGDELSDRIERCEGGVTVPHQDVDAVAGAILQVLDRGATRIARVSAPPGSDLVWTEVVEPLGASSSCRVPQSPGGSVGPPAVRTAPAKPRRGGTRRAANGPVVSGPARARRSRPGRSAARTQRPRRPRPQPAAATTAGARTAVAIAAPPPARARRHTGQVSGLDADTAVADASVQHERHRRQDHVRDNRRQRRALGIELRDQRHAGHQQRRRAHQHALHQGPAAAVCD